MKSQISSNQLIIGTAVFLVVFANLAFFRNVLNTFADTPWHYAHALSLGLLQLCVLLLLFALTCFGRSTRFVLAFALLVASITAYFMDSYNIIVDRDMIVNALLTDPAESMDLLSAKLFLYLTLLGIVPSVFVFKADIRPQSALGTVKSRSILAVVALVSAVALVLLSSGFYASFFREHKSLRYYANPTTPIYSAIRYASDQWASAATELQIIGQDARRHPADNDRELGIMVIGETARADRFSLNGYERNTNPRLAAENVVSLKHVSACGTSTAISVPCMFAIFDQRDFSLKKASASENVLDVLAKSGVHVLWRDNNSSSKGVADRVPYENYRSPEVNTVCDVECRDEGMLVGLQDYIDRRDKGDILIVLHQMGSHGPAYYKRYPPEYRVFQPTCESNQLDTCSQAEISNTFDNTILYTDHFLASVIRLLKDNDGQFETAMLYISDHGESLGESGLYLHGLPNFIAPDEQTRVPLIVWLGAQFDATEQEALRMLENTPVSHDNLFHTALGIFEIESATYEADKDLLSMSRKLSNLPPENH
jgi:lipid A ethanolaminephosphotransferase